MEVLGVVLKDSTLNDGNKDTEGNLKNKHMEKMLAKELLKKRWRNSK